MSKTCYTCKANKDIQDFNKNKSRKDGFNSICRQCSKSSSKQYYRLNSQKHKLETAKRAKQQKEKNKEFVYSYLLTHPCVACGEADPIVLEFDHLKDKKFEIARMVASGFSFSSIKTEIDKCQVLCANCHRRKTAKELNWYSYKRHRERL